MEYYKTTIYNPISMEPSELETPIPKEIVIQVEKLMLEFDEKNWLVVPMLFDPNNLNPIFKLIEKNGNEYGSHYVIRISKEK